MSSPKFPLTCATLQDDLKAYLDGELSLPHRLLVRVHLLRCPDCREEIHIMSQISEHLREADTAPAAQTTFAPALRQRILDKLPLAQPSDATDTLEGDGTPLRRGVTRANWGNYALMTGLAGLMIVASLTVMGRRISNTFSAASNQMSDGGAYYANEGAAAGAAPPAFVAGRKDGRGSLPGAAAGSAPPASNYAAAHKAPSPTFKSSMGLPATAPVSQAQQEAGKASFSPRTYDQAFSQSNTKKRIARAPSPNVAAGSINSQSYNTDDLPADLRRVHKEARMTVAVDDIEAQSTTVEQMVKGVNGYVVNTNLSTGTDNHKTATLELRVPVKSFEKVIGDISNLGDVRAKNISGEDITQQYSDTNEARNVLSSDLAIREAQLKVAVAKAEKAAKQNKYYEDPWQLRAEVRRLRIEASQTRARLELMRKLSDLSAITLQLQEKSLTPTGGAFSQEMHKTLASAGDTFLEAAKVPLKLIVWFFAYAPLWLPVLLFYRWLFPSRSTPVPAPIRPSTQSGE